MAERQPKKEDENPQSADLASLSPFACADSGQPARFVEAAQALPRAVVQILVALFLYFSLDTVPSAIDNYFNCSMVSRGEVCAPCRFGWCDRRKAAGREKRAALLACGSEAGD